MTTRTNEIRETRDHIKQFAEQQGITFMEACTKVQELAAHYKPYMPDELAERTIENVGILKSIEIRKAQS